MRRAGYREPERDFTLILMLAAVAGAIADVVGTFIDIGRAAGWWL